MKLLMRLLIISCVINSFAGANLHAQSNVFRIPRPDQFLFRSNGIPAELRGKYVLAGRSDPKTYQFEDLKKPEPFCAIQSNQIVLASGEVLRVRCIVQCIDKEMATVTIGFEGKKETVKRWTFIEKPPYMVVWQMEEQNPDRTWRFDGQSFNAKNSRFKLLKVGELPPPVSP